MESREGLEVGFECNGSSMDSSAQRQQQRCHIPQQQQSLCDSFRINSAASSHFSIRSNSPVVLTHLIFSPIQEISSQTQPNFKMAKIFAFVALFALFAVAFAAEEAAADKKELDTAEGNYYGGLGYAGYGGLGYAGRGYYGAGHGLGYGYGAGYGYPSYGYRAAAYPAYGHGHGHAYGYRAAYPAYGGHYGYGSGYYGGLGYYG